MYDEALVRLEDSDLLAQSAKSLLTQSDSSHLLRILGFEILLKCAVRLCGKTPKRNHGYAALWQLLLPDAQSEILRIARERMPGHADLSDLDRLLSQYQRNFTKARYFYELYEGYTLEQQHELGQFWEELGAPEHEADVRYYPNELDCLIAGLRAFIDARLGGASP
jgi:hypothetical protein